MSTEFTYRMSATGRGNPPDAAVVGFYDYRLVALSIVIAVLAAYPALDLGGRVTATRGRARVWWLGGGAVARGIGIWSMHYVAMLPFILPVPVLYDWPRTVLSLLARRLHLGGGLLRGEPPDDGVVSGACRQRRHGERHRGASLRGHGVHADARHVPLFADGTGDPR